MEPIVIRPLTEEYFRVVRGNETTGKLNRVQVMAYVLALLMTDKEVEGATQITEE